MKCIHLVHVELTGRTVQFLPMVSRWLGVVYDGFGLNIWAECHQDGPQEQIAFEVKSAGITFDDSLEFVGAPKVAGHPVFLYARRAI
jgi:hypothetical protein